MDLDETMVENVDNPEVDDTPVEEIVEEEQGEPEESLESITEEKPAEEQPVTQQASEPGYVQKRINKAVQKAVAETEARMQAMFDQRMAPLVERMIENEAQELVSKHKIADIEMAREYVRNKNGMPAPTTQPVSQPRQANGQFAPKPNPAVDTHIKMLRHQAEKIAENGGPDVRAEFTNNEEIKDAVIRGDMDFYDVAEYMKSQTKKRPPSPMRSPNGASGNSPNAIESMTDEQFARLEKRISEGARIRLR